MIKHLLLICCTAVAIALYSCSGGTLIDQSQDMSEGVWHVDSLASFDYVIEDTTLKYDISYLVRYAVDYPYYNLYVTYYLEDSVGNILNSQQQELILFDKTTGQPLGTGLGDLYDREVKIFEDYTFDQTMKYHFKVKHYMRMQELPGILSFGLKVTENED
ncbi:gliding motility lipoprotein GldH [Reichenbachiella ulvae]|uniref:Gliding motility lipoprotein GldH n=1 Tax=Reichenbachiella ulvae TaxID=2980104 RepID=A0ABT3CXW6_9BACT|nr:gliding motility lipoprotein GldH [Reichenbachiella ulvae]MCV9388048.1 gliding motility lipoprotein GldH [Reichenbachiella ulvae]